MHYTGPSVVKKIEAAATSKKMETAAIGAYVSEGMHVVGKNGVVADPNNHDKSLNPRPGPLLDPRYYMPEVRPDDVDGNTRNVHYLPHGGSHDLNPTSKGFPCTATVAKPNALPRPELGSIRVHQGQIQGVKGRTRERV